MFTASWIGQFLATGIRLATPLVFAALAAAVTVKAGMFNMGVEGMMLCAALAAPIVAAQTGSVWIGLLAGVFTGLLTALVISFSSLTGKTDLYLTCIAFNLMATGGTVFLMILLTGSQSDTLNALKIYMLPTLNIPLIEKIPILGPILSGHDILTYVAVLSVILVSFFFKRTRLGLRLRSVGENPQAAESVGISSIKMRYIAFILSGLLSGLGGAFMSIGNVGYFMKNMVGGRGYIGLSAMNMANADAAGASLASLFFGLCEDISLTLKSNKTLNFPTQFLDMVPYAATILSIMVINFIRIAHQRKIEKGEVAAK